MIAVKQIRVRDERYIENEDTFVPAQEQNIDKVHLEIHMSCQIQHPCVVKYIGATREDNIYNLFMEYLPMGSLSGSVVSFHCHLYYFKFKFK